MIKNTLLWLCLLCGLVNYGQVVINEIDPDTPSTDDKEFIELKSATPNFSLDGYVIVLYNGSASSSTGNKSYFALDLDGYVTDVNGLIVIGNDLVSPVPDRFLQVSTMQNGEDAIALYFANASDFPDQTPVTATNLVDAIVYHNAATPLATTLISVLGVSAQINENINNARETQSIQRKNDGTYEVKTPTPGANNDGSGISFNGVTAAVSTPLINEGESFTVTFTTQTPVASTLNFTFSLSGFTAADYNGNLNVSIPSGSSTFSTTINTIDDVLDEGDELVKVKFGVLPTGFKRMNDNVEVRVIDNDFTTKPWGTPLNPTYGLVTKQIPPGYYDALEGKSGEVLKVAIRDIISGPQVRAHNYGDVEYMLKEADQNPLNSNEVWLMYVEQGMSKYRYQTTASNVGSWNREHIYPQSRGGFANATSSTADGINTWTSTNADDINAGHADGHHIRAEDGPENTRRSNKDYGPLDYNGPAAGTQGSWRGDVARSLFYMACRYNLLNVVNGNPADTTTYQMGDLATLLQWNHSDPADDFEMNHSNVIYTWQLNRNPFVDYPDLADYIWGDKTTLPWHATMATESFSDLKVRLYPNPVVNHITVSGLEQDSKITIYSIAGAVLFESGFSGETTFNLDLSSGIYLAKIASGQQETTKKIIIR